MLAVLIALVLLAASVTAIYLLLKNMGENGIEAAAPGSCRSGRCGVQPSREEAAEPKPAHLYSISPDTIQRLDIQHQQYQRLEQHLETQPRDQA